MKAHIFAQRKCCYRSWLWCSGMSKISLCYFISHPGQRSSYDSDLRLGTSLVALRCIFSSSKQSDLYLGDQITFPYSRCGLTIAVNSRGTVIPSTILVRCRWKKCNKLLGLLLQLITTWGIFFCVFCMTKTGTGSAWGLERKLNESYLPFCQIIFVLSKLL